MLPEVETVQKSAPAATGAQPAYTRNVSTSKHTLAAGQIKNSARLGESQYPNPSPKKSEAYQNWVKEAEKYLFSCLKSKEKIIILEEILPAQNGLRKIAEIYNRAKDNDDFLNTLAINNEALNYYGLLTQEYPFSFYQIDVLKKKTHVAKLYVDLYAANDIFQQHEILKKIAEIENNLTIKESRNDYSFFEIVTDQKIDTKMNWIVPYFLPKGGLIDVYGGPESGKTTSITTLLTSLACQVPFYPFKKQEEKYKTLIVGGEKNSLENWKRSINYILQSVENTDNKKLNNIRILDTFSTPNKLKNKYLLKLDDRNKEWIETETWERMIKTIKEFRPDILLIDTMSACFLGYSPNLWVEHQELLLKLNVLAKQYNLTVLTVSHTNQQSKFEPLWKRLDLTSRSGNNEIPGELRCFISFTLLHFKEVKALEYVDNIKYIAVANAKSSEFSAKFTKERPAIFQLIEGKIQYIGQIDALKLEDDVKRKKFNKSPVEQQKEEDKFDSNINYNLVGWED